MTDNATQRVFRSSLLIIAATLGCGAGPAPTTAPPAPAVVQEVITPAQRFNAECEAIERLTMIQKMTEDESAKCIADIEELKGAIKRLPKDIEDDTKYVMSTKNLEEQSRVAKQVGKNRDKLKAAEKGVVDLQAKIGQLKTRTVTLDAALKKCQDRLVEAEAALSK